MELCLVTSSWGESRPVEAASVGEWRVARVAVEHEKRKTWSILWTRMTMTISFYNDHAFLITDIKKLELKIDRISLSVSAPKVYIVTLSAYFRFRLKVAMTLPVKFRFRRLRRRIWAGTESRYIRCFTVLDCTNYRCCSGFSWSNGASSNFLSTLMTTAQLSGTGSSSMNGVVSSASLTAALCRGGGEVPSSAYTHCLA